MSAALQRVVVRLLHDPALVDAVYAGAPLPELSAQERAWLLAVDRRAFGTDPWRRSRLLHALIEELPASSALLSEGGRRLPLLDAFLSSPDFHRAVQDRGVPVLAFADWLAARVGDLARLEGALARARRDPARRPGDGALQRARGLVPVQVERGTLARWQALLARLGAEPVAALVGGRVPTRGLPARGPEPEPLLVEVDAGGAASISQGSDALCALLEAAADPVAAPALVEVAAALGAGDEAAEVVAGLLDEGLLVRVSAPGSR